MTEPAVRYAKVGDLEIAYDVTGDRGTPLVLVMGIGAQRIFWDAGFVALLVDAGFQVVRFDHRDIGQSTHLPREAPVPQIMKLLAKRMAGLAIEAPYSLSDMASDVVGVLDAAGIERAHVVGASLGGMVGQHLAIEHPARVRSLTAIMTSPGARRFLPEPYALQALLAPAPKTREEAGRTVERMFTAIGSPAWATDGARLRAIGELAYERGTSPRGFLRHFAAVLKSGDRSDRLTRVVAPTLVIHGSRDPMFPLAAGRALSTLVQDGTWLPIAGMGHDLPHQIWPTFVGAIRRHAARADAARV
ncbi:MAG: alpha/beta hydrolase [Proteobacteria bacterium]|nr:alpha/beta hydrolase [Pseudomonadota bacterium]